MMILPVLHRRAHTSQGRARRAGLCLAAACCVMPARAQYTLMRANLHAHTRYSDADGGDPSIANPGTAAAAAKTNGLDAFATTDHGEALTDAEWLTTKNQLALATQPGAFVALWGFEWTGTAGSFAPSAVGMGHFNVFGSLNQTGKTSELNGQATGLPANRVTPELYWYAPGGTLTTNGSFYRWISDPQNATSPLGGSIVAQFNHPALYPLVSFANPSNGVSPWWRKLQYVPALDPFFTLMEMSARTLPSRYTGGCLGGAFNEPYFQLALDNGWHVAPTNNEDNHTGSYGNAYARTSPITGSPMVTTVTGVWSETEPAAGTAGGAQAKFLAALRERRVFSSEDPAGPHSGSTVIRWTVNTVSDGVKWMGTRTLKPEDVGASRLHLEVTKGAGLTLQSVEVVTNRGAVARALPVSGAGVTVSGSKYTWDFGLPGDAPGAQLRATSDTQASLPTGSFDRPPLPAPGDTSSLGVVLNAAASPHIERYYYLRVTSTDGKQPYYAFSAPVWIARAPKTAASFRWDFGDGATALETSPSTPDAPFGEQHHIYPSAGTYYPRVTITYTDGTVETATTRVVLGAKPSGPLYGDVNGDGQINDLDLALLSRYAAGTLAVPDANTFARANVQPASVSGQPPGAGTRLDIADVLRLARFLRGLEPSWP